MAKKVFMFDVESTSLHGEGFAVGFVLAESGEELTILKEGVAATLNADIRDQWVIENVIPGIREGLEKGEIERMDDPKTLRDWFWEELQQAKKEGAEIWSDCNWPVETNFLSACVADRPGERAWEGPYPLKDLATLVDVDVSREEVSGLKYNHNPLNDAEASLVTLHRYLKGEI